MADLFDRFNGTAGTTLASHAADSVGDTWSDATAVIKLDGSGSTYCFTGFVEGNIAVSSWAPPGTDYAAEFVLGAGWFTTAQWMGVALRLNGAAGAQNYYFLQVAQPPCAGVTGPTFYIASWVAGTNPFVDGPNLFGPLGITPATNDVFRLEVAGTGATVTLRAYRNGTLFHTSSDNTASRIVTTGKAAIRNTNGDLDSMRAIWAGAIGGPTTTITPSAPTVLLGATQGFTAATVETNETINWTASAGSCSPTTGPTTTWTAPSSGTSATVTWTSADLPDRTATATVALGTGGGATAYTLLGASPATGPPSVASGNFTVQLNGTASPSAVITPHSTIGGDTFTPATLTISDAAAHTFVLNPSAATGARTISVTHTGGGFSGDPASVVYTVVAATSFTLTGPSSGFKANVSTPFTFTPVGGSYTGTITPTMTGLAGTWAPTSLSWSASSAAKTATFTPSAVGAGNANGTASPALTAPANVAYTSNAQTLGVTPGALPTSATTPEIFYGGGTFWLASAPTFTPSGSVAGVSCGAVTVISNTEAHANITTGTATGTFLWTDSTTGATASEVVASITNVLSIVQGLPPGLSTVGYAVYDATGSMVSAWTAVGVTERGTGSGNYGAVVPIPAATNCEIRWSVSNAAPFYPDVVNAVAASTSGGPVTLAASGVDAIVVETGINLRQAVSLALAALAGKASGLATNAPVYKGAGTSTTRIAATTDANGNRSAVTLTPPA